MSERDEVEQDLRIEQMAVNIEKLRADIEGSRAGTEKLRAEMRWELRKFVLQAIIATAAAVGAGVALGRVLFGG